jgi:transcriptional regulator with XRE-family HTH domain
MEDDDFHIGKIIKGMVSQKHISSASLIEAIHRYQKNADKIYKLEDMDVEDVIQISYALKYNILEELSQKYLSHLPHAETGLEQEKYSLTLDMQTKKFTVTGNTGNCDFLRELHFGDRLRKVTEKNGWSSKYLETKLNCSQSTISDLFKSKSLKVKKLFRISDLLRYNLVEDVHLSKMCIVPYLYFDECIITLTDQQVRITKSKDNSFSMNYRRQTDEISK